MSTSENWLKLHRWWQEHFKSHFISSSSISLTRHEGDLRRCRRSSISFHSTNRVQLQKMNKRASCSGIEERYVVHNDNQHLRDRIREVNLHTAQTTLVTIAFNERHQFEKPTTSNIRSDEVLHHTTNPTAAEASMNKKRTSRSRRFSLARFELSKTSSNGKKDGPKPPVQSNNFNLIQKLLFRQINPKTRPFSATISSDDDGLDTKLVHEISNNSRQSPTSTITKDSYIGGSSSTNSSKQNLDRGDDNLLSLPSNKTLSKSHSDLNSYLSKRRNTTGSISFHKIVDPKSLPSGNTLKLPSAVASCHSSSNKLSPDRDIFQAIEESDFSTTQQLIEANEDLVKLYNENDWRPLDTAIMLNNILIIQLLLHRGAEESPRVQPEECRYQSICQHLSILNEQLSDESAKKYSSNKLLSDENQSCRSSPSCDRQQRNRRLSKSQQYQLQQQRSLVLTQMKENYEHADPPDAPTNVHLLVTGSDNITVTFDEPLQCNGAIVTKYKVEWSTDENFDRISLDTMKSCWTKEYVIRNLLPGTKCYVRVAAGNMKGFGPMCNASPRYCVPSSWRDLSKTSRTNIYDLPFEEILNKIGCDRGGRVISKSFDGYEPVESVNRRNPRRSYGNIRKNLRQLFQFYPRLAKTIKRGLYLVSVMLNGDRILVTNEDVLPMVEVDENYGHNLLPDFQWFMKLTFVWDDLKCLRPDLQKCSGATSFYLRIKLVQAAMELQKLEEMSNLGRLHHTYIRDNDGNVAFVLIHDSSSDARPNVSPSNLKWVTMSKFVEVMKESQLLTNNSCLDKIIEKLPEMIDIYHASMRRLDSGLYVAYLKMQNSVDSVRVMVNKHMPGALPCVKIRSVANVSKDEWEWLHTNNNEGSTDEESSDSGLDLFKNQFRNAAKELFILLNLPETHFSKSRIYDSQVVEIRDDLSLIILMSTADEVNILSKPSNHSSARFIYLPVYIFEIFQHLSNNYRFICQYSRVSVRLDFELLYAQQNQREALSTNELDETRCRLKHLLSCQQDLDDIWRLSRWLVHVINCAKDKTYSGISLKSFQSSPNLILMKPGQLSSLSGSRSSEKCLIQETMHRFADTTDDSIELTLYRSHLKSNTSIPFKLRVGHSTRLNEISRMILKQDQDREPNSFLSSNSMFDFVWVHPNNCEHIIEDNLTAFDIHTRLSRYGGRIYVRSNNLSAFRSPQMTHKASTLFPPTFDLGFNKPRSNLSLNI